MLINKLAHQIIFEVTASLVFCTLSQVARFFSYSQSHVTAVPTTEQSSELDTDHQHKRVLLKYIVHC